MDEGRSQMESLVKGFYEIEHGVKRLGCRLRSDIETVDRLEANFKKQLIDLEILEQRFLIIEGNLRREETTTSVAEVRQIAVTSGTESNSSVEQKEEPEEEESVEILSASLLRSDTERILKLKAELLERQTEWKREREELLLRQKQLEEQIRFLQEHLSRLPTVKQRDAVRKRKAAKGPVTLDVLDKTLFPVVVQCFVALSGASSKRRIESSCLLIQRIFRGYAVRKRIQLKHRPKFIVHRKTVEDSESVFISDADQSLVAAAAAKAAPDQTKAVELNGEHHIPALIAAAAAAAAENDLYDSNNKAKDGDVRDVRSLESHSSRPKPRKGSLSKILQASKTKASAAASCSSPANRRSWSVSGTTEWQDPTDTVIHGFRELKQLELFFADKIAKLSGSSGGKSSVYDVVFAEALREFHSYLTSQLSSATQVDSVDHGYKDLMNRFAGDLKVRAQLQLESSDNFPHPLFINAFRGFIDEFLKKKHNRELPNIKTKKDQQKTSKSKIHSTNNVVVGGEALPGSGLSQLSSSQLLVFVDRLTAAIESKGLSVVGLYRVAGNAVKIKQLIKDMTAAAGASVELELGERDLHVMASVLKSLFREMPQPLIPLDLYEDFVQLPDGEEKSESFAIAISKLPEPNRDLLNRLVTHLAKVAKHESSNRMSASALAIVFAPCLLRLSDVQSTQLHESRNEIQKQTTCLQFIIESQLERMKNESDNLKSSDTDTIKVTDIDTVMLDDISATEAEATAISEADSISVSGSDNVDVIDNIVSTARMSKTDTAENDAVNEIDISANQNDPGSDVSVFDNATTTVNDSARANEADTAATTSEGGSVVNSSAAEDEQKKKTDDEESLSFAGDDLDLDFTVDVCSEDGDDDFEVEVTTPSDDLSEGPRSTANDDDDVASSPAPHDETHANDHEEPTKNLKWSEDSLKDPQQQQRENSSTESLANTDSSASVVNTRL